MPTFAKDRIAIVKTSLEEDLDGEMDRLDEQGNVVEAYTPQFVNTDEFLNMEMNAKQDIFVRSRSIYPAMLGAKGASKTWGLIFRCLYLMVESDYHGDMAGNRGFLARKEWQSFKTTVMREVFRVIPRQWIRRYLKADRVLVLENGSELVFGHFDDLAPIMGVNLGFAGFSQIEQMAVDTWEEFQTNRVRMVTKLTRDSNGREKPLHYRSCFAEGNPPGPAHWTYGWFANERSRVEKRDDYDSRYHLIHSRTEDNKDHLPADHIENARKNLSARKFRRDIEGSAEGMEGQCLEEFDEKLHVAGSPTSETHKSEIIPLPHWKKCIAIDYGRRGNACSFYALDEDNFPSRLIHFDEAYIRDGGLVDDHVKLIKQKLEQHLFERTLLDGQIISLQQYLKEFHYFKHDPSMARIADTMSARTGNKNVTIVGLYHESFYAEGMPIGFSPADNDVDAGLDRWNFLLKHKRFVVNYRCRNTINQMTTWIIDGKTGKPAEGQEDHQCDSGKYGASAFHIAMTAPLVKKKESIVDKVLREAKQQQGNRYWDPVYGRMA